MLRVPRNGKLEDLEERWREIVLEHGGPDLVPYELKHAYHTLRGKPSGGGMLDLYRAILGACAEERPVEVAAGEREHFERFCRDCGFVYHVDPLDPGYYEVRRPDQEPPQRARPHAPVGQPLRPTVRQELKRVVRYLVTFGPFRGQSRKTQIALAAAYLVGAMVIAWAVRAGTLAAVSVARAGVERYQVWSMSRFEAQLHAAQAGAADSLSGLRREESDFLAAVQSVVGVPYDTARSSDGHPADFNNALLVHESVREAWASILNSELPQAEVERVGSELSEIARKLDQHKATSGDEARVGELATWVSSHRRQTENKRKDLEHIRMMLEADRAEGKK